MKLDFERVSRERTADRGLARKLHLATTATLDKRAHLVAQNPAWAELRVRARQIKLHTLTHLPRYMAEFAGAAEASGASVHWADTAADACERVVAIARAAGVRQVVKAKSMTSEEIDLNAALIRAGIEPLETDFGEWVCQLAGEPPSHVTAPIIHRSLEEVAHVLFEHGIIPEPPPAATNASDPAQRVAACAALVAAARAALRERFLSADMGVSGANFAVAETGSLVLVENEANIRLSTSLPGVHVAIVGIDKLIPTLADLGTFLTLLAPSATGQRQSCYVSLIHRPIRRLEIVLLDNGRLRLLADPEQFDLLSCIRCGACMNVCPVYRHVSGNGYGGVYPGPIGAVLQPHIGGPEQYGELPFASSLCGACTEICPVGIPLHERLLQWRQRLVTAGSRARLERWAFAAWAWLMRHPALYRALRPSARWIDELGRFSTPGRGWARTRELPRAAEKTFAEQWQREHSH